MVMGAVVAPDARRGLVHWNPRGAAAQVQSPASVMVNGEFEYESRYSTSSLASTSLLTTVTV